MTVETDRQYLERIRELAAADDREGLDAAIGALEPSEAIRAILRLEAEGLVVGVTLALNTLIAVSIGGTVPLLLKRIGVDPAIASSPILTTITDICGFFLALSLASLLLAQLT